MTDTVQHVTVDCSTKEESVRQATPEEVTALLAQQAEWNAAQEKAAAELAADMKLLSDRAAQDATFAALLRVLRVSLS
jgi:hypothetical protein